MRLEIDSEHIHHLIPDSYEEEDILFDWYEQNRNDNIFKNISLEWYEGKNEKSQI
jgi:hypothetical protein